MPDGCDLLVVGAGVIGCAAAYHAARQGASVTVIDRGRIGGEQSSRAWGFVRQQGRHPAELPLAAAARRLWETLEDELDDDIEFARNGILVPGCDEADALRLRGAAQAANDNGVSARLVDAGEMRALLPGASPNWPVGLYTPGDAHADPPRTVAAFAAAARRAGAVIEENTPAFAIRIEHGRAVGVETAAGFHPAGAILCAAGIGAADLCRTSGIPLPILVMRASVGQTRPAPARMPRGGPGVWAPNVAFRPCRDGSFIVANGYHGIDAEHDLTVASLRHLRFFLPTFAMHWRTIRVSLGREAIADLRRRASAARLFASWPEPAVNHRLLRCHERAFYNVYPALAGIGLARSWAGRIDATPDLIPIIEAMTEPRGLYLAAGFNGHGFALAPAVGHAVAELIRTGHSSLDLRPFRLGRFAEGAAAAHAEAL